MFKAGLRHARSGLLTAVAAAVMAAGCGGDETSGMAASGGSLAAPASREEIDRGSGKEPNRAPVIESVRFSPETLPVEGVIRAQVAVSDPDGDPVELGYLWTINGERAPGGSASLSLPALRKGDRVAVRVVASDGRDESEPFVHETRVGNQPPRVVDLVIHMRGRENGAPGEWVVEPVAEDPDGDRLDYDFTWKIGSRVVGRERSLTREGWSRGDEIRVTVVARDGESASAPAESAPIQIGNSPPDIVSRPPGLDARGRFEYRIEATDPDGDRGLRYSLGAAPEGMQVDAFDGTVTWQASLENAGEHKVEVIVDDRNGGTTKQVFFVNVRAKEGAPPAAPR